MTSRKHSSLGNGNGGVDKHINSHHFTNSSPNKDAPPPLKGYLLKKSHKGKWQRRYFEIKDHFLTYRPKESSKKIAAAIDLRTVGGIAKKDVGTFFLLLDQRKYELKVPEPWSEDMILAEDWVQGLLGRGVSMPTTHNETQEAAKQEQDANPFRPSRGRGSWVGIKMTQEEQDQVELTRQDRSQDGTKELNNPVPPAIAIENMVPGDGSSSETDSTANSTGGNGGNGGNGNGGNYKHHHHQAVAKIQSFIRLKKGSDSTVPVSPSDNHNHHKHHKHHHHHHHHKHHHHKSGEDDAAVCSSSSVQESSATLEEIELQQQLHRAGTAQRIELRTAFKVSHLSPEQKTKENIDSIHHFYEESENSMKKAKRKSNAAASELAIAQAAQAFEKYSTENPVVGVPVDENAEKNGDVVVALEEGDSGVKAKAACCCVVM
jgi:hypothetical protein